MGLRSKGRNLSFEILSSSMFDESTQGLHRSNSDAIHYSDNEPQISHPQEQRSGRMRRKNKKKKKKKPSPCSTISEDFSVSDDFRNTQCAFSQEDNGFGSGLHYLCKSFALRSGSTVVTQVAEADGQNNAFLFGELRQRAVLNGGAEEAPSLVGQGRSEERSFEVKQHGHSDESNGSVPRKLETAESLDWKQLMAEDQNCHYPLEKSPVKYFVEEMRSGNSLSSTTTRGNDKERERVYDTIFRLPWRCELLIDVGVFVCFDSFLSLMTIMPTRILVVLWKIISTSWISKKWASFFKLLITGVPLPVAPFLVLLERYIQLRLSRLSAAELSDIGCFLVLICTVALLQWTDISLIYHMIRGQATIKLYVVYNVLEIFDKLCQSFGGDVFRTLFTSAEGLATCLPENTRYWTWRFTSDLALTLASSIVHSFILLAHAITLSACIVAHNNSLMALLVSNNFSEIKSNVFKRFSKDNIHRIVYSDSVERFHISAFVFFVLAQNIREAEGPWFESFLFNVLLVYACEILVDIIKHSFIAKFNDIKPGAYSEFLEDLCKQTLNIQTNLKNTLTFVPLAPACVVIRVLTTVSAAHLPHSPFLWRLLWILILFGMTYVMLVSLKVMVRMGLQKHAAWYIQRCERRKLHSD